jgi:hypothetical protein
MASNLGRLYYVLVRRERMQGVITDVSTARLFLLGLQVRSYFGILYVCSKSLGEVRLLNYNGLGVCMVLTARAISI